MQALHYPPSRLAAGGVPSPLPGNRQSGSPPADAGASRLFALLVFLLMAVLMGAAFSAHAAAPLAGWASLAPGVGGVNVTSGWGSGTFVYNAGTLEPLVSSGVMTNVGGSADSNETWAFLLRPLSYTQYPQMQFTTASAVTLTSVTFTHYHNHSFATDTAYDVQLQLDAGSGWENIGSPVTMNSASSSSTSTVAFSRTLPVGSYKIRWFVATAGIDLKTDFFALATAHLLGNAAPVSSAPTDLRAVAYSQSQIKLNWTDNSNDETGFNIYRNNTLVGSAPSVATNVVAYNDTGLTCGTSYSYAVKSVNGTTESTAATLSASTEACPRPRT